MKNISGVFVQKRMIPFAFLNENRDDPSKRTILFFSSIIIQKGNLPDYPLYVCRK